MSDSEGVDPRQVQDRASASRTRIQVDVPTGVVSGVDATVGQLGENRSATTPRSSPRGGKTASPRWTTTTSRCPPARCLSRETSQGGRHRRRAQEATGTSPSWPQVPERAPAWA